MLLKAIPIILIIFFNTVTLFGQDLSGYWQGVEYQNTGGSSPYYPCSMLLSQNGSIITGTTISKQPGGSPSYVQYQISGTVSTNIFAFSIISIISQIPPPGAYRWCTYGSGTLNYDSTTQKLLGPTASPGCAGDGSIELWRLKVTSDTMFCQGQPVHISVTGQNVKWYSDNTLLNLVDTGNYFSPAITATTTFYATQTHYNTESPAAPIKIYIKPKAFTTVNQTICEGSQYMGHAISGIYVDTYPGSNGCDSIRTLNLTVKPKSHTTVNQTICEGEQYLGYKVSGTYVDVYPAANGCDSVRTLNLTVKPKSLTTVNQTICEGDQYLGYKVSGTYVDTYPAANGCDSVRTLHLIVKPKLFTTVNQSICEGDQYLGYKTSGTYIDTYTSASGCDSTRTLHLTVKPIVYCRGVIIPNTFSPNNDGVNDTWNISDLQYFNDCTVEIFDRSGKTIYKSTGYKKAWDGTYNGHALPTGTYYYKIDIPALVQQLSGWVLIIK